MTLLDSVRRPEDLRRLGRAELDGLAAEIRRFLIDTVCRTGGHLGPNLGVVELTIALHRVFDSPEDPILWDTGHQAYVHKLLTGRKADFGTLRRDGGLSGYPSPAESPHDFIENSHASTALSHADGLSRAFALTGQHDRTVVAVVGDGAMTGGMCWEALNNIGAERRRRLVIVLNDNGRSYDPTGGGFGAHLADLRAGGGRVPALFSLLGLGYLGPVDGHDIGAVEAACQQARDMAGPVVVHCLTHKGFGYPPAENDQADRFHAIGVVDPATGQPTSAKPTTWTDVFGAEITKAAAGRPDVVAVTAAMRGPTGLGEFARRFPDRFVDVGIAEQHAVTASAGLATGGVHPVVAVYATFLNRAFDQALMDVALHRKPVTFVLDRAGVTGEDGPSHHGMWDLSVFRLLPGIRIAAPRDAQTLATELREALSTVDGPTMLRFPKAAVGAAIPAVERVRGLDVLREDARADVLVVSVGAMAATCLDLAGILAEHGIGATVVDPRWVVPVNPALADLAAAHRLVVTVEDNIRAGGVGSAVSESLAEHCVRTPVRVFGLAPEFLRAGRRDALLAEQGLTAGRLAEQIRFAYAGLSSAMAPKAVV
ncbi:1-deoxy-D-xylulose-5-phosphate synthase [Kutzneria sp. CA-103260]|uniref:1-deoxy-D-xylulose-5-phosphate synthase n=1 Tax=Kutzneria sp. CA-103260 TaxID=2802641 RepID=UPI001BAD4625|nr:1-deoxy-D-xylulose-5-phosphate synthase [Kutzneria sp. CA-103260]QUQ65525.1 1-deoxy-D-xylulose-5-phosphate synthase [Kutzneria sp. CA-103260]